MNTQEYTQVPNCFALTIKKEHRLIVFRKATTKAVRMSIKTLLYMLLLMCANILV